MRRKKRPKSGSDSNARPRSKRTGRIALLTVGFVVSIVTVGGALFGGSIALARISDHVNELILADRAGATLQFTGLPESLLVLAAADLQDAVGDLRTRRWTDADLCEVMANRLTQSSWVKSIRAVRRTGDGRFEISAIYRSPVAAIQRGEEFFLVDAEGVRLPGVYTFNASWKVLRGVASVPPTAGKIWDGGDLQAGLKLLRILATESFFDQITGILVDNFGGRSDPRGSHIELLTDRHGGRIRWGSAPGRELEENSIAQKLALLRQNFVSTGRADADRLVIDVATYPDRFIVCYELG
ncbi:MAG: hypothetical protein HY287_05560 [Planctomycetes bacterium]|nr:hypothetical protein [Planctomycetota bacterium]MBI3833778.1 hypothetical protein [Planctomycetota bacterium]